MHGPVRRWLAPRPSLGAVRTRGGSMTAFLVALVLAAPVSAADLRRIDASNVAEVAGLLPDPVHRWIERGDFVLNVTRLDFEPRWDASFVAASEANRGLYDVDERLNVIDAASGERPDFVFGFPFPEIDPEDSRAGAKIMWNRWFGVHKRSQIRFPLKINIVGRGGLVRTVGSRLETLAYQGREGGPLPNPEGTEWREIVRFVSPSYVEGTTTLTWRFFDESWDNVWLYLPLLRRIRQGTSTNRSDALAGSDVVLDDGLVWAGKNQSFTWKLAGSREVLVPVMSPGPQLLHAGAEWENGTEWLTGQDFTGVRWGWESDDWTGAPWAPVNALWVKRPVWVVEGRSRDPYYSYGRQLFYLDQSTFHAYYKVIETPAGEHWKTVMVDMGMACAPANVRCYPVVALSIVVDDKNDRATATTVAHPDNVIRINTPSIHPENFTVQGLLKKGK